MAGILAQCLHPDEDRICVPCCELQLGESLSDIQKRTNRGIPKGKYYRDLINAREAAIVASRGKARGFSPYE